MRSLLLIALAFSACSAPTVSNNVPTGPTIPVAARQAKVIEAHGDQRQDDYYWLRDRSNPDVIAYLEAENAYTAAMMKDTESLQRGLFDEMVARIREDDETAPYRFGAHEYFSRTQKGKNYEIHLRRKDGVEQVLLDENLEAADAEYFATGVREVSPDEKYLAYSVDKLGNERYALKFRDLETGKDLEEVVENTYYSAAWAGDSRSIFYTRVDAANRPFQIWRHTLGDATDELVYEESDEAFHLSVATARSQDFVFIQAQSAVTTEYLWIPAKSPGVSPSVVIPRQNAVEYYVDHSGPFFYVLSNEGAQNFRLLRCKPSECGQKAQREVVQEHDAAVTLTNMSGFKDFLALEERRGGVTMLKILDHKGDKPKYVPFPEASYTANLRDNYDYASHTVRFRYSSMVTPRSTFDFDVDAGTTTLIKQDEINAYDPAQYVTERLFAEAADGVKVPVSIVYRKGALDAGPAPLYMTGYGAYGINYDPYFSSSRVSLLDRGVVFAIAHVRGGADLGRAWYENGKYLNKRNTFGDFIAAAEMLVASKKTTPEKLAVEGSSAGGMLIGAVINMRPDLFRAAVAGVPFVDVVTTMLDETIPLTVIEWEEWGNPNKPEYYAYMKSYSPYDNVVAQAYPALLVTAGLNDPRVQYWEPAKWVAKLRTHNTGTHPLLLKTNMSAGHGGASGRYDYLKETAFEYAFVLRELGVARD